MALSKHMKSASNSSSEDDLQKFEYESILKIGLSIYEGFYKLAPMSFTINAVLLGAASFLLSQGQDIKPVLFYSASIFIVAIAVIYNLGALFAYVWTCVIAGKLVGRLIALENEMKRPRLSQSISNAIPTQYKVGFEFPANKYRFLSGPNFRNSDLKYVLFFDRPSLFTTEFLTRIFFLTLTLSWLVFFVLLLIAGR
jgi:hypothetical protein